MSLRSVFGSSSPIAPCGETKNSARARMARCVPRSRGCLGRGSVEMRIAREEDGQRSFGRSRRGGRGGEAKGGEEKKKRGGKE